MKTSFQRFLCLNLRRAVTSDQVCQGGMRVKCARGMRLHFPGIIVYCKYS